MKEKTKGSVIFSPGYPLGAFFKGSEIFFKKIKGSEKIPEKFKGSEKILPFLEKMLQAGTWEKK